MCIRDRNKAPNPFIQTAPQDLDPQLNPKYNFDNYFEGTSNKLVRTAGGVELSLRKTLEKVTSRILEYFRLDNDQALDRRLNYLHG